MAPLSDPQRLLELLQRATEELKVSRGETAESQREVTRYAEKLTFTQAALAEAQAQQIKIDGSVLDALGAHVTVLQNQLQLVDDELTAHKEQLAARVDQVETEQARAQALVEELQSVEAVMNEERVRFSELEAELNALRLRRDELNIELGQVENERTVAQTQLAEIRNQFEQLTEKFGAEKSQHQHTAQKLLHVKELGRDLETQLKTSMATSADLGAQNTELTRQVEVTTSELRHVEKQYEQLHKEMLQVLDQRDEARREIEAFKQRFGVV